MNFNSEFSKENLLELYSGNKEFSVPILAIFISIVLFVFMVIPQIISFPSKKAEADQESVKLNKIQAAYDLLSNLDGQVLDTNLTTAQKALPDKKDFESVLNSISSASGNSQTQIIDYTFQSSSNATDKYPTLLFKIEILGGVKEATNFINELYKTYPLSDATGFTNSNNISKIDVVFYYRAFPPITIDDRITVAKTSQMQEDALKTISGWTDTAGGLEIPTEASASSSTPF